MRERRHWLPVLLLALLPLFPLWRCVFLGETIGPWDFARAYGPQLSAPPNQPFDVLQMDAVLQFYPWRDLVLSAWRAGELPLWNPYVLMGNPLAGNSQSGAFYPPHILLGVLGVPVGLAITLLAAFHLALAGIGVYFLCQRLGGHPTFAWLAGASFSLSAFMVAWAPLASVPSTVAWYPWLALGLVWIANEDRWRGLGLTALSAGMMLLAGHLQFAAYGFMLGAVAMVGLSIAGRTIQPMAFGSAGFGLGALMAWPHLQLVFSVLGESHRRAAPTAEGWSAYAASGLRWWEWTSLGVGDLLGSPVRASELQPLSTFWPVLVKPGANYAESAVTVGAAMLALALVALAQRAKGAWVWGALVILGGLLASASPVAQALYFGLPGWSGSGSPGRAAVLVVFGACVLAGLCQPVRLQAGVAPLRQPLGQGLIGAFVATILGVLLLRAAAPGLPGWNPNVPAELLRSYIMGTISPVGGVTFAVVALVMLAFGLARKPENWQPWVVAAGVIALLPGLLAAPIRSGQPPAVTRATTPVREAVVGVRWDLLAAVPTNRPPNLGILSRVGEIGGYDSLIPRSTVERLRELNGQDPAPPSNGNMMLLKNGFDLARLADLGVSRLSPGTDVGGSIATVNGAPAEMTWNTEGVRVRVPEGGAVVVRIGPAATAWQARWNGQPARLQSESDWPTFQADAVGELEMKWPRPLFWPGLLGWALCLGALAIRPRRASGSDPSSEEPAPGTASS